MGKMAIVRKLVNPDKFVKEFFHHLLWHKSVLDAEADTRIGQKRASRWGMKIISACRKETGRGTDFTKGAAPVQADMIVRT